MVPSLRVAPFVAVLIAALIFSMPVTSAISADDAAAQLQFAKGRYGEGQYVEAFRAFELVKTDADPRMRREALIGCVKSALRLGEFSHAYEDAQLLAEPSARDAESMALYGDALWAAGLFEASEQKIQDALAIEPDYPRALHGLARSLTGRNRFAEALQTVQSALSKDPRDAEFYHTAGSIHERTNRYQEAATAYSTYIDLTPNKDRNPRTAWARAEVQFLRSFGARPPVQIDPSSEGKLHTVPFRIVNEKIIVKVKVNGGRLTDFVLDTGAEQTAISSETAARMRIRPITSVLSAGVGELGVRGLGLTRLDELEIGSLKVRNVPSLIESPPRGLPRREIESFSPMAFGLSAIVDYDRQLLLMGAKLPDETADIELPLRMHRLAMVPGQVQGRPASFVLDTGGSVVSISSDTASGLEPSKLRNIPLKVYGVSGWDRSAFLRQGVSLNFASKIEYPSMPVVVLNLRAPSVLLGFRVGGIVGHRFLSGYRVAIDLDKSIVQLQPAQVRAAQTSLYPAIRAARRFK